LIGCDGARLRRPQGDWRGVGRRRRRAARAVDLYRAPDLIGRQTTSRLGTGAINPRSRRHGVCIDGRERWLVHNYMKPGEGDFDSVDRDACIRTILGVGADFKYEIISREDWYGRRLIADKFRDRWGVHRRRCGTYLGPYAVTA